MNKISNFFSKLFFWQPSNEIPVIFSIVKKNGLVQVTKPHNAKLVKLSKKICRIITKKILINSFHLTKCLDRETYLLKLEFVDQKDKHCEIFGKLNCLNKAFEMVAQPFLMEVSLLDV